MEGNRERKRRGRKKMVANDRVLSGNDAPEERFASGTNEILYFYAWLYILAGINSAAAAHAPRAPVADEELVPHALIVILFGIIGQKARAAAVGKGGGIAVARAEKLAKEIKGSFIPSQFSNIENANAQLIQILLFPITFTPFRYSLNFAISMS